MRTRIGKVGAWARVLASTALCVALESGCSWVLVSRAPTDPSASVQNWARRTPECTASATVPIIDTTIAGAAAVAGIVLVATEPPTSQWRTIGPLFLSSSALIFAISAVDGFKATARCREYRECLGIPGALCATPEAPSERELVANGSELSLAVIADSDGAVALKLTEVDVCREAEYSVRAYRQGKRRVSSRWVQARQPCAGAGPRPVAHTAVLGHVWFDPSRPAFSFEATTDEDGRVTFRLGDLRAAAAYCGSAHLRFEPMVTGVRSREDTPADPYIGRWLSGEASAVSLPPGPRDLIRNIADAKAADAARRCCEAELRSKAVEPCRDACGAPAHASDCLEAARACSARGNSAEHLGLSCDDAFSLCLLARGTERSSWDRCQLACIAREVQSGCH